MPRPTSWNLRSNNIPPNELIEAQRAAAEQFVNTQAIAGQARARELTPTVLDLAVKKVAPVVIAAI